MSGEMSFAMKIKSYIAKNKVCHFLYKPNCDYKNGIKQEMDGNST